VRGELKVGMTSHAVIPPSDWKRKAIHAGMGLFALALRWLDWKAAALLALAALLFNLFVMPRIGRGIYRDEGKTFDVGIVAYPAMVLVLILLFRHQLEIAAMVWVMMAFGDPAASVVGRLWGGPTLPWNPTKTWTGFVANWLVSAVSAALLLWFWVGSAPSMYALAILAIGGGLYSFLESVRAGIDDNLVAALPTALAIAHLAGLYPTVWAFALSSGETILLALLVNVVVALLTRALRLVSDSGAVAGAIVGFLVLVCGGWSAYGILWAFFLLGTAATKLGYRKKAAAGVAQANRGRRGTAHVLANCAVPTAFLMIGALKVAFAAALAAALADTLGTEIGTLYGKRAYSPLTWKRVPVGTPGAVSLAGTAASLAGAILIAVFAWWLLWVHPSLIWLVATAGFVGACSESLLNDLGARVGFRLDHDFANALNTFVAGLAALFIGVAVYPFSR